MANKNNGNGRTIPDAVIRELNEVPIHAVCDALGIPYHGDCPSGHDSEGHNCFKTFPHTNTWYCYHCTSPEVGTKDKLCIGCIGLVETKLKCNTPEACRWIADHFRPDLKQSISSMSDDAWKKYQEKMQKEEQAYKALDHAMDYYNKKLWENKEAVNYLTGRGITEEFIRDNPYVKFGHAPLRQEDLKQELFSKFGEEITLATGLFSKSDKGFIFPTMKIWIEELKKEVPVITYSYQMGGHARYIIGRRFTPVMEGEIMDHRFSKLKLKKDGIIKNEIFGINSLSIENPQFKNSVLVAEGLFDAILAINNNIPCISPITVKFSDKQLPEMCKTVRKFETIYIVPDPDSPGEKGAVETAKQLIKEGKNVKVVTLPRIDGVKKFDLADYFKQYTAEDFFQLCSQGISLINFLINSIPQDTVKTELNNLLEGKDIIETIQTMDAITQEHYREVLSKRFNLDMSTVKDLFIDIQEAVKTGPLPESPAQEPGQKKEEYPPLVGFTLKELMAEEFPPIKYLIQDILPEGLTILAGKPKIGKSIFALNISLSIAKGCTTLGKLSTEKTNVAYFALEDHKRRLKKRTLPNLNQMIQDKEDIPDNFTFFNSLLPLQKGGFEQLNSYLDLHPEVKFIVIDTIGRVKNPSYKGNCYEVDTQLYSKIHEIYLKKNVSVLVITHTKKQEAIDFVDNVTGSSGGTGVADTVLVLSKNRSEKEAVLKVTGRDIDDVEDLALRLNGDLFSWEIMGEAGFVNMSKSRQQIIDILKRRGATQVKDLVYLTGKSRQNIQNMLLAMEEERKLIKVSLGNYDIHPLYKEDNFKVSPVSVISSVSSVSPVSVNINNDIDTQVTQVTLSPKKESVTFSPLQDKGKVKGDTGDTLYSKKVKCADCKFSICLNTFTGLYKCSKGIIMDYDGVTDHICHEFMLQVEEELEEAPF